jgi:hypothetical protein
VSIMRVPDPNVGHKNLTFEAEECRWGGLLYRIKDNTVGPQKKFRWWIE